MKHAFKGALHLQVLDQLPIDKKYSPDNCLCVMEDVNVITQMDRMRLKFCKTRYHKYARVGVKVA